MDKTIKMLQDMERELSIALGYELPDFNDTYHTCTDDELEVMADEYARTHHAPNTTPVLTV